MVSVFVREVAVRKSRGARGCEGPAGVESSLGPGCRLIPIEVSLVCARRLAGWSIPQRAARVCRRPLRSHAERCGGRADHLRQGEHEPHVHAMICTAFDDTDLSQ